MSTWNLLSNQHQETFKRLQLLEEASIDLLAKRRGQEKDETLQDFLKFFKIGLVQHFKIEEMALFPILKNASEPAKPIISEIISEHKDMVNRYFKLQNSKNPGIVHTGDVTDLLKALAAHAEKEEKLFPPLIALLSKEQLRKIDELAKRVGYSL